MKLAKKMLACVIALAIIGCFAVTAFAANAAPSFVIGEAEKDEKSGITYVPVTLVINNAAGLKSGDLTVTYDATALKFSYAENGADAAQQANVLIEGQANAFNMANNSGTAGSILTAFTFTGSILPAAEGAAAAAPRTEVNYDDVTFECIVYWFEMVAAKDSKISVAGALQVGEGKVDVANVSADVKLAPPETTTAAPETTTGVASGAPIADTGDKPNTGDNMALAAAAGVILLAGAAFVVTKKRK